VKLFNKCNVYRYLYYPNRQYALCIVCFTLNVKLTKINCSWCVGQFGCVYLVWPNVHGIYTSTLYIIVCLDNISIYKKQILIAKQRKLIAQHYKKAYKYIKTRAWRVLIWGGKITMFDKSCKKQFSEKHHILMHDHNVAVMLYMWLLLWFIIYVLCCMCYFKICFVYCVFYAQCEVNQN
jgi:hypothetical protein